MMARQDASDLAHRLGRQAEAVCRHYLQWTGRGPLLAGRRRTQYAGPLLYVRLGLAEGTGG